MLKDDILNYFNSLNKTQKFNWLCNFMTLVLHKEFDERYAVSLYTNYDSNNWQYNNARENFRKKIINAYKKPTETKLHSIAAEVYCFNNNKVKYDSYALMRIEQIYACLYSYFGQEILQENKFTLKKNRPLTQQEDCIQFAVNGWLAIHNEQEEKENALLELKNLSLDFDKYYWKTKEQTYTPKESTEPVMEREVPDLTNVSGAGKTKAEIYSKFITGVQAGELPCIDVAIREMETADDHIPEKNLNNLFKPQNNVLGKNENKIKNEEKEDKDEFTLRDVPRYLEHEVFGVDFIPLTQKEFLSIVELENQNEIFYSDWKKEQQMANFQVVKVGTFQYNILNKDNDKPFAFLDAYVDNNELLYKIRYFNLDTECFFCKLYDMDIEIN